MDKTKKYIGDNKEKVIRESINQTKGDVCKEFEKVCLTDTSFKRMKKEMHDLFDKLEKDLLDYMEESKG